MSSATLESTIVLGPEHNGILMSVDEFDAIKDYDGNYRYELIHGVMIVCPIPLPTERVLNDELAYGLRTYQVDHPNGDRLDFMLPENYVQLDGSRRRADRVLWCGLGRKPDVDNEPPTIAIEIVSKTRRDRRRDYEEKRDEYLGLGIVEYWAFDRFLRRLTVFTMGPNGPIERVFGAADTYETPLLPGFVFNVAHYLTIADEVGD